MALLFEQVAAHFALMETMTTRDYLAFRDKLSPASGFQSAQLREIEILLGLEIEERIPLGHEHATCGRCKYPDGRDSPASRRVAAPPRRPPDAARGDRRSGCIARRSRARRPSRPTTRRGVDRFIDAYCAAHARELDDGDGASRSTARSRRGRPQRLDAALRAGEGRTRALPRRGGRPEPERAAAGRAIRAALLFIESYRELPLLAWPREVVDAIVALEQAFVIFRQRHARMVERVIGRRTGTGGSAGVDYLDQTALKYRIFRDVWAVRTLLIREAALPPLEHPEVYNFVASDAE